MARGLVAQEGKEGYPRQYERHNEDEGFGSAGPFGLHLRQQVGGANAG